MKLQDQVCTIEQGKRLFELGLMKISAFYHIDNLKLGYEGIKAYSELRSVRDGWGVTDGGLIKYYSAFTVAEIICMMPDTTMLGIGSAQIVMYRGFNSGRYITEMPTEIIGEIDAIKTFEASNMVVSATDMLIYLLENKYTTAADCNARLTS